MRFPLHIEYILFIFIKSILSIDWNKKKYKMPLKRCNVACSNCDEFPFEFSSNRLCVFLVLFSVFILSAIDNVTQFSSIGFEIMMFNVYNVVLQCSKMEHVQRELNTGLSFWLVQFYLPIQSEKKDREMHKENKMSTLACLIISSLHLATVYLIVVCLFFRFHEKWWFVESFTMWRVVCIARGRFTFYKFHY